MKVIPAALLADMKAECTTLAFLWTIEMANGKMIRGTEHDLDITIPLTGDSPVDKYAGTYKAIANITMTDIVSSSDLSVDNSAVQGAFPDQSTDSPPMATVLDVTVDEIESGLLDAAPVTILICNWAAPGHGYFIPKSGFLGVIDRTSDGAYTTEIRGLTQPLTQTIIRTVSETCDVAEFGDLRCKLDVAAITAAGTVSVSSADRHQFALELDADSPPFTAYRQFVGGTVLFTSGPNEGFFREVKIDPVTNGGIVQFWDEFPEVFTAGDRFLLKPGCTLAWSMCKRYLNGNNFRGVGLFVPGAAAITAGPTTTSELGS